MNKKVHIISSRKKNVDIYAYHITKNEFNNLERLWQKRSSFQLESSELIITADIIGFGEMKELYHNWSKKYRDLFLDMFDISEKKVPDCDMGWVNTKFTKKEVYEVIRPSEDVIMRTQKQFPLSLLYNAIERSSPNRVMDWDYILFTAVTKQQIKSNGE